MRRGEIWTVSAGGFAGKPRPALVVQSDAFEHTPSITICAFTSDPTDATPARVLLHPTAVNGLRTVSWLMVDKVSTVPRDKLGRLVGTLDADDLDRSDEALALFLGLA